MRVSPQDLSVLPDVPSVRRSWKAAAMFDAIAEVDEHWRVFQFRIEWRNGADYGYVDTRQGDCVRGGLFSNEAVLWGYNEGSPLSTPLSSFVRDEALAPGSPIPPSLRSFLGEPEFDCGGTTFCVWRSVEGSEWRTLNALHSSPEVKSYPFEFVEMLSGDPRPFANWVREYYERRDADAIIEDMYSLKPLSRKMIRAVNPDCSERSARQCALGIGYPME